MAKAPYFKNARLLLAGDCTAFAFASMHPDFIKGRVLVIGCPKLDDNDAYVGKLSDILVSNGVKDISLVHMEVPCCGGIVEAVKRRCAHTPCAALVSCSRMQHNINYEELYPTSRLRWMIHPS